MNLDRAIGILNYSENAGLVEARIYFQEKLENIQFLADTTGNDGIKELYLVQITNLKSAWQLIKSQENELVQKAKLWEEKKKGILISKSILVLQKEAEVALQCAQIEWSRQLFTIITELQPRDDFAFKRIKVCNYILSEYKKAERERERLRNVEEARKSKSNFSDGEKNEDEWIKTILLKNDNQIDGQLSPWLKSLFLSRESSVHISHNQKKTLKKEKKEAILFSSIVLLFVVSVLTYSYSNDILSIVETSSYEKDSDGSVIYTTKDYIKKADDLYVTGNYVKALIQYSLASATNPKDEYVQEQIAVCKLLIRQNQNSLSTNYVSNTSAVDSTIIESKIINRDGKERAPKESEIAINKEKRRNQDNSVLIDTVSRLKNVEFIVERNSDQSVQNISLTDSIISDKGLDSLLLTDDSTFVANIDITDTSNLSEINKINPTLEINDNDLKHRIIQKANEKLKEDNEFLSKVYLATDIRPSPYGGFDNFDEYLKRNMEYPKKATRNKIQGVVYVQFIVNRDGTISDAKTTTNLGYGLEEEAIRLISEYPGWVPGQIDSRKVNVQTSLPIWFVNQ